MTLASAVELLRLAPFAYAHYQLIFDDQNKAIDFVFRDVNPFFERMIKLNRESILGKSLFAGNGLLYSYLPGYHIRNREPEDPGKPEEKNRIAPKGPGNHFSQHA